MSYKNGSSRSRLAASAAVVFACLWGLDFPAHADLLDGDLLVSDLGKSGIGGAQLRRFTDTGVPIPPTPFLPSGGGEGMACLSGSVSKLFVASNNANIGVYDRTTGTQLGTFTVPPPPLSTSITSSVAALSLNQDGSLLYAADYFNNQIVALDTTTGAVVYRVATTNSHDVVVGPDGVYATNFDNPNGVLRFPFDLTSAGPVQFIAQGNNGLKEAAGMAFDNASPPNLYVSNFNLFAPLDPSIVNEYTSTGVWIRTISFTNPNSAPLGLAFGPDGNLYGAELQAGTVGKVDVANAYALSTFVPNPDAGPNPKYLSFLNNCVSPQAVVEVCKSSSLTSPVTGSFTFTSPAFTKGPITVPVGACSGPIPVSVPVPAGPITITELPAAGVGVSDITAYGYNSDSIEVSRLAKSDLPNRTATVNVVAGDVSTETVVNFTNFRIPTGVLEVCKDAAPGSTVAGSFSFNVSGAAGNPYVIPTGSCSGPILVQAGSVTITESPSVGFQLVDVSTLPLDSLVSVNMPGGSAVVTVAAGDVSTETVVRFVNGPVSPGTGQLKICKIAGAGITQGQRFPISANGLIYPAGVPAGPASQGGFCVVDSSFPVGTVVTVQETPSPTKAYQVLSIAVNPPSRSSGAPDLANGTVKVTIGNGFTEVTFTNIGNTPTGQLKICKVAGAGVTVGTNFSFTAAPVGGNPLPPQTSTVPAGPGPSGYCVLDGTFPLNTQVTVAEVVSASANQPPSTSVTGIAVAPSGRGGTPSLAKGTVPVTIGSGFTEVTFTNTSTAGTTTPGGGTLPNVVRPGQQRGREQQPGGR